MVLNNVTKFHKILIKTIQLREQTSFKTVNYHKQRPITAESIAGRLALWAYTVPKPRVFVIWVLITSLQNIYELYI